MKLKVVSYLLLLLCVFTVSCLHHDDDPEWEIVYRVTDADGCETVRYKKEFSDRIEYKEEVTCPDGTTLTDPWTEYK